MFLDINEAKIEQKSSNPYLTIKLVVLTIFCAWVSVLKFILGLYDNLSIKYLIFNVLKVIREKQLNFKPIVTRIVIATIHFCFLFVAMTI